MNFPHATSPGNSVTRRFRCPVRIPPPPSLKRTMTTPVLRALVVDDEPISRLAVSFALEQDGFNCTLADNGNDAWEKACSIPFDIVISDLCMPVRHGHSLATDLLTLKERPLVVIHTGIDDPRLTRDLMARGVDDVIYKPTNYAALAEKLRRMVSVRRQQTIQATDAMLTTLQQSVPQVSTTVIDTFFAASNDDCDLKSLLQTVMQDSAMTELLLRLANSARFKRNDQVTTDVLVAARCVGMKNLAELALQRL